MSKSKKANFSIKILRIFAPVSSTFTIACIFFTLQEMWLEFSYCRERWQGKNGWRGCQDKNRLKKGKQVSFVYFYLQYPLSLASLIWAASWQNQRNDCAPSEDSDQPGHPPSLIRDFAFAQWVAKDPSFLNADSEDSDQTGRMPRLFRVFAGRTCHFVGFVTRWLICTFF